MNFQIFSAPFNFEREDNISARFNFEREDKEACFVCTAKGFSANWTKENGNFLARKGIRPGSRNAVVIYQVEKFCTKKGISLYGVYGFTKNPLTEFYIVENWGVVRPPGIFDQPLGPVTVDGVTYDQFVNTRSSKASIDGEATTFKVFWSVRRTKSMYGAVRVQPHFDAWQSRGYDVGDFFEVSFVAEGARSEGYIDVDIRVKIS